MTPLALLFMILSWSFVLGLAGWCFHRVLRAKAPTASGAAGPADDRRRATEGTADAGAEEE